MIANSITGLIYTITSHFSPKKGILLGVYFSKSHEARMKLHNVAMMLGNKNLQFVYVEDFGRKLEEMLKKGYTVYFPDPITFGNILKKILPKYLLAMAGLMEVLSNFYKEMSFVEKIQIAGGYKPLLNEIKENRKKIINTVREIIRSAGNYEKTEEIGKILEKLDEKINTYRSIIKDYIKGRKVKYVTVKL